MIFVFSYIMDKNEEKDGEIEVLKERVDILSRDIDKYMNKMSRKKAREKQNQKKENRGYFRILVILIIIIVIVDILSLVAYYKPNFSSFLKFSNSNSTTPSVNKPNTSTGSKCSDGTADGTCSKTKPLFCYNGSLVKRANSCGCPSGYVKDFQDCVAD
jgi:hypothetical protein